MELEIIELTVSNESTPISDVKSPTIGFFPLRIAFLKLGTSQQQNGHLAMASRAMLRYWRVTPLLSVGYIQFSHELQMVNFQLLMVKVQFFMMNP